MVELAAGQIGGETEKRKTKFRAPETKSSAVFNLEQCKTHMSAVLLGALAALRAAAAAAAALITLTLLPEHTELRQLLTPALLAAAAAAAAA